jgi:hypothetical protein
MNEKQEKDSKTVRNGTWYKQEALELGVLIATYVKVFPRKGEINFDKMNAGNYDH